MFRAMIFLMLMLGSVAAWGCTDAAELTAECADIELERVTTAYLKAATETEILALLAADPSPDARLVGSMLLAFPPNFDEDPAAAPAKEAMERANLALAKLLEDHPDQLLARIVAIDRCGRCDAACVEEHASALRRDFPDDAYGYLVGAHNEWKAGRPDRALELLRRSGAAEVYGGGGGALVRLIHDVLDRLPLTIDDPYARRDVALYEVGFGLAAGLAIPYLRSIQEICRDPGDPAVVEACLAGTRALTLPGTNLVHSSIALHVERNIFDALGDEGRLERAITQTAVLNECAEAVSSAGWHRDPAATVAYIEDLEHHGECRALARIR